jgi:hypothetical protein
MILPQPDETTASLAGVSHDRPPRALLEDPNGQFARHYNRSSFMFDHGFTGNPIFELESLIDLSRRLPEHPHFAYWSNGPVGVEDRWEKGQRARLDLQQTIAGISENNSLVILKHVEQDPVFAPLLQEFLRLVVEFCGPGMKNDVIVGEVLILVSSPNRVTSYHIDAETNYLVQVTGNKTAHVFPHDHPAVVTDIELERFHAGDFNGASYRQSNQESATVYDFRAGRGIHIPTHAPHWVQNGNNISVALSVNFELKSVADLSMIYRFNRWLRRAGVTPKPPGSHPLRDGAKLAIAKTAFTGRRLVRPDAAGPSWVSWTP